MERVAAGVNLSQRYMPNLNLNRHGSGFDFEDTAGPQ